MSARILHVSVPVNEPRRAAELLARLTAGVVTSFRARGLEGAYVCGWNLENNELIEFIPHDHVLEPDPHSVVFARTSAPAIERSAIHVQIETPVALSQIRALADEHGLLHGFRHRGTSAVYEVWIEPGLLIELVAPWRSQN